MDGAAQVGGCTADLRMEESGANETGSVYGNLRWWRRTCEGLDEEGRGHLQVFTWAHRVFTEGGSDSRDVDDFMGGHLLETATSPGRLVRLQGQRTLSQHSKFIRERRGVKDILGRIPEVLKGERVLEVYVGRKWGE